jgi:hypothetical protein
VWETPASSSTESTNPNTLTGEVRVVVVPSPSCPLVLLPQQSIAPVGRRAQVCVLPATTSTASLIPTATTGTRVLVDEALPSCPLVL